MWQLWKEPIEFVSNAIPQRKGGRTGDDSLLIGNGPLPEHCWN